MKKIFIALTLWGVWGAPIWADLWLVEEEFIKIDKKEIYESLRKEGLTGSKQPQLGFYDAQERAYIYLRPFADLKALDDYRQNTPPSKQQALLSSILNFSLSTLQEFEPTLSSGFTGQLTETPSAAYQIYTVLPEGEKAFRDKIRMVVLQKQKNVCWGVWKVVYGSELPKYVVGFFAPDEKTLEAQLKAVNLGINNKWIRRQEQGRAVLVPELSRQSNKD
jgi:hypothetical protein